MIRGDIRDGLVDDEPAQQEPVAVPTTSYEHRKFVLVGRDWYERFAAFHDDCQIGEQLTWQEKTIRQQGYENGWNDAQRYLKEPQSTSPTQEQIVVGAKALGKRTAQACEIDEGDQWRVYGEVLIEDARAVLTAAFNLKA